MTATKTKGLYIKLSESEAKTIREKYANKNLSEAIRKFLLSDDQKSA
jgi:hypothetical protein